jgi:ubiquinone/menaquinone biosynthesis C-methylase UbiE
MHDKIQFIKPQKLDISDIDLNGRILDIGGGGEGIIGQFKGERVIAIDPKKSELEEATPGDYLKIIMNAKDLQFLDETFDTVTAFFTFMYIPWSDHEKVLKEIYRVTKKGGEFVLWDFKIPKREGSDKEFFGLYLEVKFGEKKVETGYATRWNKVQDIKYYLKIGSSIGFASIETKEIDELFYIKFQKT